MDIWEKIYDHVAEVARENELYQTERILPYAKEKHEGMYRKGAERIPYIIHPLTMAKHAISMGLIDDDLIATALLHDVCEDCDVAVEELPVNDQIKHSVSLLTKKADFIKERDNQDYYEKIAEDRIASIVKILDRCNNISAMSEAFSRPKVKRYALETESYLYPLIESSKERYPEMEKALFIMEYHIRSVLDAVYHLLKEETPPKVYHPDSILRA